MTGPERTFDVRIWAVQTRRGQRATSHRVRWLVGGHLFTESFATRKLADSFRAGLVSASSSGEPFDQRTGRPQAETTADRTKRTWVDVAREFIDDRWPDFAPRHRKSTVEGLVTLTCALTESSRGGPDSAVVRAALTHWEFNPAARARREDPAPEYVEALAWLHEQSLFLTRVAEPDGMRAALRAIGLKLDGTKAAAATTVRKRAALSAVLNFAVESRYLTHNPLRDVRRKRQLVDDVVDPRVVVNPDQARRLLASIKEIAPDLHAYFATLYYAAARPAEARNLRPSDLHLPERGWGRLTLAGSYQEPGAAWTDNGARGEERQLKHRPRKAVRLVPAHPTLVTALRDHLTAYETAPRERLFVARTGRGGKVLDPPSTDPVGASRIYRIWSQARAAALTPEQAASPLAARPYDLRHAAVSTWLAAGVAPTQVAEWAGHGVDVLLRVYAKCLDNSEPAALARIDAVFNKPEPSAVSTISRNAARGRMAASPPPRRPSPPGSAGLGLF